MVEVENLRKSFGTQQGQVAALAGISFTVRQGCFFTLLGPSGCGKSTTLRCIAGLERADEGEILIGDKHVFSSTKGIFVPPNKRDIGMVFQSYAIWPHMTVFKNVAYPLKARHLPRHQAREKISNVLELVGLKGLEERLAPRLSGGQQQRVALARALVAEPDVLLLDEPLSNLDAKLRSQMRSELKALQSRVGTTAIYVTHDQVEALSLSDEIALMNNGRIIQIGTPEEIYSRPANEFAADFIGAANIIEGELTDGPDVHGNARVRTVVGDLRVLQNAPVEDMGKSVLVAFRPEAAAIFTQRNEVADGNILQGKVQGYTFLGEAIEFQVAIGKCGLRVRTGRRTKLKTGECVYLAIPTEDCLLIRRGDF